MIRVKHAVSSALAIATFCLVTGDGTALAQPKSAPNRAVPPFLKRLICAPDPSLVLVPGDILALDVTAALPVDGEAIQAPLAAGAVKLYFKPSLPLLGYRPKPDGIQAPFCDIEFSAKGLRAIDGGANDLLIPSTGHQESCVLQVQLSASSLFRAVAEKENCAENPSRILSIDCQTGGAPMTADLLQQLLSHGSLTNVRKGCRPQAPPRPAAQVQKGKDACPEPPSGAPLESKNVSMFHAFQSTLDAAGTLRKDVHDRLLGNPKDPQALAEIRRYFQMKMDLDNEKLRTDRVMDCFPNPALVEPEWSHDPQTELWNQIRDQLVQDPRWKQIHEREDQAERGLEPGSPPYQAVQIRFGDEISDLQADFLLEQQLALSPEKQVEYFTKQQPYDQFIDDQQRSCVPSAPGP